MSETSSTSAERRPAIPGHAASAGETEKPRANSWLNRLADRFARLFGRRPRTTGSFAKRTDEPVTVGVDLLLMQPGGANGGVKPLVFSFLEEIERSQGDRFRFVFFASPELAPEFRRLMRPGDRIAQTVEPPVSFDVLYAPFGRSVLMNPDRPTVSLIVDLLHRDLPSALPIEEVNYRHEWFTRVAADAARFQCISSYTAGRLQTHYGVEAARCFVTHIPVHERLGMAGGRGEPEDVPVEGAFFFYPANFWPHKNHERLLGAYRLYCDSQPAGCWPLVFTGHADARMQTLIELAASLGLSRQVHFLGHVGEQRFAAIWNASGALVYPSLHEGFGIPLLEAMAFKRPIIASNATSIPEVGGDACVYVDPRDEAAIAKALSRVSGEAELRRDLVQRGAQRLQAFSLAREAAKLAEALSQAASRKMPDRSGRD